MHLDFLERVAHHGDEHVDEHDDDDDVVDADEEEAGHLNERGALRRVRHAVAVARARRAARLDRHDLELQLPEHAPEQRVERVWQAARTGERERVTRERSR